MRSRPPASLLWALVALGGLPLGSGCQLIVSFDRTRIVTDAGLDGAMADGGPADGGAADVGDAASMDARADAGALDAPDLLDAPMLDAPDPVDAPMLDAPDPVDAPMLDAPDPVDAPMLDAPPVLDAPDPADAPAPLDAPEPVDAPPAPDAGPCGGACTGATPICDSSDDTCVECLVVGDCTAAGGCVGRQCVACDADDDCPTVAASACSATTNTCEACAGDADCAHLTATPVCNELAGRCVACTADTEAARCGANSCVLTSGTCSTTARGSLGACEACTADSECSTGARCVAIAFGGSPAATYCLFEAAGGCGDTVAGRRPFTASTGAATSLGGVTGPFCAPPATTSCDGVWDLQLDFACVTNADCGLPGEADGLCLAGGTCSYACALDAECPGSILCGATSMVCDGP